MYREKFLAIVAIYLLILRTPQAVSAQGAVSLVSQDQIKNYIIHITDTIGSRRYFDTTRIPAANYVANQFSTSGLGKIPGFAGYLQEINYSSSYGNFLQYNVAGVKTGAVNPNKYYLVMAHLDTGADPPLNAPGTPGTPGAEDDASGVGVLLETARVLKNYSTNYSIIFLATALEEPGSLGAAEFMNYLLSHNLGPNNVIGVINLDAVGQVTTGEVDIFASSFNPSDNSLATNFLSKVKNYTPGINAKLAHETYLGDLWPFVNIGGYYNSILIHDWFTVPEISCRHQTCDTYDNPAMNYSLLAGITKGIVGLFTEGVQPTTPSVTPPPTNSPTPFNTSTPTTVIYAPGDINKDGKVNQWDMKRVLNDFSVTANITEDADKNGKVNILDTGLVYSNWTAN